jgi:anaerobic magnesium-protoporphyrin IX monomethyl ester cyclase
MANVILLSPPYLDLYGRLSRAAGRYFPLGLGYIAAYLRREGSHRVRMYEPEAQALSYEDIGGIIRAGAPDVVGITSATPNFPRALELARVVRKHSQAKIVLGGVHASALPEFILQRHGELIDAIVTGEGEETMRELVAAFESGRSPAGIPGVVYRDGGRIVANEPRAFIDDLDTLPFPARDLIPQTLFMPNLHNARYRRCLTILTSRGCPFDCSFCASRLVSGRRYRTHSAEYVLDEMEILKRDYQARQLIITDDTFTVDNARLEAVCRGMIGRRLNLEWFCFSQVHTVNRELLALMRRAGCTNIGFGIESADPAILKRMGKPIRPEGALAAIRMAREAGMKTQAFYVLGSPGETGEQMEATVRFARKAGSTLAFFNMLVPYPGTRDFRECFADVPLEEIPWEDFVAIGEHSVLRNRDLPPGAIEKIVARANLVYYLHPLRLADILYHIRTFYELANYLRGVVGLAMQVAKWARLTGPHDDPRSKEAT